MKYLLLAALLVSTEAYADRRHAPFQPHDDKRFDEIEDQLEDNTEAVGLARKSARFVYDVAVDGGESTEHDLGIDLPAGAIITGVHLYINTAFTDSGTGSVALECAGTRDIMGYRDLTAYAQDSLMSRVLQAVGFEGTSIIAEGVSNAAVLASSLGASVPTACDVTAVVRSDAGYVPQTAGKLTGVIEYFTR